MSNYYIGLGANLNDRISTIQKAICQLRNTPGFTVTATSTLYETLPWGKIDQPPFINGVVAVETQLDPDAVLDRCQEIEQSLGRVRHEKWGPRTIDIDLLYAQDIKINTARLTLPHPFFTERAFVLVPLAEIAGNVYYQGKPFSWYRDRLVDTETVLPLKAIDRP